MPRTKQTIPCPHCGGESSVLDTRLNGADIKRRRRCLSCNETFGTIETDINTFNKLQRAVSPRANEIRAAMEHLEKALK